MPEQVAMRAVIIVYPSGWMDVWMFHLQNYRTDSDKNPVLTACAKSCHACFILVRVGRVKSELYMKLVSKFITFHKSRPSYNIKL